MSIEKSSKNPPIKVEVFGEMSRKSLDIETSDGWRVVAYLSNGQGQITSPDGTKADVRFSYENDSLSKLRISGIDLFDANEREIWDEQKKNNFVAKFEKIIQVAQQPELDL